MPISDPTSGRIFIWLVACLLFTSVALGGSFLILYVTLPENVSQPWLPFAGVGLVCLPWLFWLFTCVYRIISRTLGFRFVLGSDGGRANNNDVNSSHSSNGLESTLEIDKNEDRGDGDGDEDDEDGRQVKFAGSVVLGENNNSNDNNEDDGDKKKTNMRSLSKSNSSNNLSFASHESEVPLTSSVPS